MNIAAEKWHDRFLLVPAEPVSARTKGQFKRYLEKRSVDMRFNAPELDAAMELISSRPGGGRKQIESDYAILCPRKDVE